ncbi:MAG: Pyk [Candidatus Magasanikbacteria bacterium GW2011_GWA2_40_10]|uniref:Pyruvate kinase n=1 Tax=Candidatus Magasanikbacteria bacterium GW2011_GWA2_40_10 TaxID=1619037 RepID=A0A0G0Q3N7_9BACT|nr:MAG: Pyk [Candidatus Magasanikbacteria bacterium GW2011_GWA2_40_10]
MFKKTKICCTIGPSCDSVKMLMDMVKAGMNIARLNFSHGDYASHAALIQNIRKVEEITGEPIAIMQDLQGPKIRVGIMPEAGVPIKVGQEVIFDTSLTEYKGKEIPLDYHDLHKFIEAGQRILVDDGHIEVKVKNVEGTKITAEVMEGTTIFSRKGLNLPDSDLDIAAISEKDKKDLKFGVEQGVDLVALSFVRSAKDIIDLRFLVKQYEEELGIKNQPSLRLISKIERRVAVDNLDEILDVTDGIMVARGDLGLEMPAAEVPLVQKRMIDAANAHAKPVIVATQMLDSMRENRRPTRAEVSDVANAVIDHADTLMLSNETAVGKHPILVVETMADIIVSTEKSVYDNTSLPPIHKSGSTTDIAITELSRILAEEVKAKIILAASISGETGRLISHVRPPLYILVGTSSQRVQRQLNLSWGVVPFILEPCRSIEELVERSIAYIKKHKIAKNGDQMVVVAGEPVGQAGNVNLVEVREIR